MVVGHIGKTNGQANRVYDPAGKSTTLTALAGGGGGKTGLYVMGRIIGRKLNADGKRDDTNDDLSYTRTLETRSDEKSNTLTQVQKDNIVVAEKYIRKLTPIECERLQSLPDNYTAGISNTARYKALGNAFNVEVIKFILSFLPL
jgi:DNA (cytosine-5)-methyltransferase 3A